MLLLNHTTNTIAVIGMTVPGARELIDEMGKEIKSTYHIYSDQTVAEYEMFGAQVIFDKEWLDSKQIRNPYWKDRSDSVKAYEFIIDGKPNEKVDDPLNYMYETYSSDGNTLEIYDYEKGNPRLVIQIIFGIGGLPVKTQKYLWYLMSKMSTFPDEININDIDQAAILYKRFRDQYFVKESK